MSGPWQTVSQKPPPPELIADPEERDFRVWLRAMERRAIVPLKWTIFLTAAVFWGLSHSHAWPPPVSVFALFTIYFMFNLGNSYLLLLNRVTLSQIRVVSIVSYYIDVLFVTALIFLESKLYPASDSNATDFYLYYFILVLRSFALFRTSWGNLLANAVVAAIFIYSVLGQDGDLLSYSGRNSLIRIVFIWILIMMSWFIVSIINRQKAELVRTREKLVQSENLALIGELAAGVAHEINNPIGIITTYSDFLRRSAPPDDERQKDYQVIYDEATRCEAIVKELLTYARPSAHDVTPVDLAKLNDEVLDFVTRRGSTDAAIPQIIRHYETRAHWPLLDPAHLKQALLNIYINSTQALEGSQDPKIEVRVYSDNDSNHVVLHIEDNGPGISKENLRRIFDPFFTTRARGTGLGLSITRRLVEACGGEVLVRSKKDVGTTVELRFPME